MVTYNGGTAGRVEEKGEDRNGGGLAGTVGSEEAEDLTFLDVKGDVVDSNKTALFLAQIVKFKYGWHDNYR